MGDRSVVEYFGEHESYSCGYCKSDDTSYSHGVWGHILTPQDYQDLIDRGWRRSGNYCYKPTMNLTCCPQYTIRCEALKFKLSKSQKKILKRVKNFLIHGQIKSGNVEEHESTSEDGNDQVMECVNIPSMNSDVRKAAKNDIDGFLDQQENLLNKNLDGSLEESAPVNVSNDIECLVDSSMETTIPTERRDSCRGPDPNKPRCRKAKEIRREKKRQKLLNLGISAAEISQMQSKQKCDEKTLEDFISDANVENACHRLELRLVPANLNHVQFSKTFGLSHSVYEKYQMTIHRDPPGKCHKAQFTRFLVNNPYQFSEDGCGSQSIYGGYHQQYWLDDKLVAVGVIDILPYCVSSVYFYYDPDYSFLSLGTYAALREIALTRELYRQHCDLKYYYMGFYIHSCPKMKYKGSYMPSFLLCPETYLFKPIEDCLPKLDLSKYSRLEEDAEKEDADGVVSLEEVMILYKRQAMTYTRYKSINKKANDEKLVREYASLIGRKCYRRILLYRSS